MCVCVRACARARVCVCVCVRVGGEGMCEDTSAWTLLEEGWRTDRKWRGVMAPPRKNVKGLFERRSTDAAFVTESGVRRS